MFSIRYVLWCFVPILVIATPVTKVAEIQNQEPDIYHLPDNCAPTHYEIAMIPDLATSTFTGFVKITIQVIYATFTIKLHSKKLEITQHQLEMTHNGSPIRSKISLEPKQDLLIVESEEKLIPMTYTLGIWFKGVLNEEPVGFYKSSYTINNEKRWLAITQFEPNYARQAFPCFDETRFKTTFDVRLARHQFQTSTSNMVLQYLGKDANIANREWDTFKRTSYNIPTYLLSFQVSEFIYLTDSYGGTKIMVYARKNSIPYTSYAVKQIPKLMKEISDFVEIKFDLEKLDFIAVPDMKLGAMQHLGIPTFREMYLLLDEQSCAEIQKTMVTLASSHEIAAQWFNGFVSPAWWDSTWLVQGLAGYFEYMASAAIEPSWNLEELFIFEEMQASMWAEITSNRAMTSAITKPSELASIYNVVTWDKASCVFRMLEHVMQTKGFKCGLRDYINSRKNRFVTPEDLYRALEEQTCSNPPLPSKVTLTEFLRTWTNNIGFPLITVTRSSTTNKMQFQQTTYKSPRSSKPIPDQEWIVPITYTTKSEMKYDTTPILWSIGSTPVESTKIVQNSEWVLCNIKQSGYYRVNYDLMNWERLTTQLKDDHEKLPVINRAQLIDDSFALAYDDKLSYVVPLELAKYLQKESHILPWLSFTSHQDLIYTEFRETKYGNVIATYIEKLLKQLYVRIGFNMKSTDSHILKVGYPLVVSLACKIGMKQCVEDSLKEWKININDLNKVQPDLKGVVFCTALAESSNPQEVWDNLWKLYKTTDFSYLKILILQKLGCARDKQLLKKTLTKLLDPSDEDIRQSEKKFVVNSFFYSPLSVTAFLEFLKDQISEIDSKYDDKSLSMLISIAYQLESRKLNEEQYILLNSIKGDIMKLEGAKYESLKNSIEKSDANGAKNVDENKLRINKLVSAFIALGEIRRPDDDTPESPKGHSAAVSLIPSWHCLIITACAIYYTFHLPRFQLEGERKT